MRKPPLVMLVSWLLLGVVVLATSASDDFNRANAGTLGPNWTLAKGTNLQISSNQAVSADTVGTFMFYNQGTWGNDQSAEVTMVDSTSAFCGVCARLSGSGGTEDGYCFVTDDDSFSAITELNNGTNSALVTGLANPADGSVIKIDTTGATITVYDDGVSIGSTTDATIASGNPGVYGESVVNPCILDNFSATDSGGPPATPCRRLLLGVGCDDPEPWRSFHRWLR